MIDIRNITLNKYCSHCNFMKKYKAYCQEVFNSTYFDKTEQLTLPSVMAKYSCTIPRQTVYNCLKRHHAAFLNRPATRVNSKGEVVVDSRFAATETILDTPTGLVKNHELGLDEFINKGRDMVARGEIAITAANYITAIRIKSEIDKSNKDRKLDLLKSMFSGAAPEVKEA